MNKPVIPLIDLNASDVEIKAEMKDFIKKLDGLPIDDIAELNNEFCKAHLANYNKFMTLLAKARMELNQLKEAGKFFNPKNTL